MSGLRAFQERVLAGADGSIAVVKSVGGQGVIAWDIEGQEYPQSTSYVCDPEKLQQLAPEMESAIQNESPYAGMRLADAFFKKFKDAGLKIGVCIRPQELVVQPNGSASQVYLDAGLKSQSQISAAVSKELIRKITYAKTRWAIDFVYIDSTVTDRGGTLNADVFRSVLMAFPDMLLIPEQKTSAHFAYAAPWSQPSTGAYVRTPPEVKRLYPKAFSSIYIADAPKDAQTGNLSHYDQYVLGCSGGRHPAFPSLLRRCLFQQPGQEGLRGSRLPQQCRRFLSNLRATDPVCGRLHNCWLVRRLPVSGSPSETCFFSA